MSNILNAVFDGSRRKAITCPLFQYDYGQILKIAGIELPASYQVQFSNTEDAGVSKTMLGDADGVQIPDEYLLTGDYIYAFIYLHETEDDGETEYVIEIPVIRRPVPSEETPTPAEQSLIDQLLAQLNQGVEAAEAAADQAGAAAETAVAGMIDDTLTIQGKAADAKKTGDELTQLKSDFTGFTQTAQIELTPIETRTNTGLDNPTIGANIAFKTASRYNVKAYSVEEYKKYKAVYQSESTTGTYGAITDENGVILSLFGIAPAVGMYAEKVTIPKGGKTLYVGAFIRASRDANNVLTCFEIKRTAEKESFSIPITDFVQGAYDVNGEYESNDWRITQPNVLALPYGDKTKVTLTYDGNFLWAVRAGTRYNNFPHNLYWFTSGDTVTFEANDNYFVIAFSSALGQSVHHVNITPQEVQSANIVATFEKMEVAEQDTKRAKTTAFDLNGTSRSLPDGLPMILHISDIHGDFYRVRRFLDLADKVSADMAVMSGDFVANDRTALLNNFDWVHDEVENHSVLVPICAGNHDLKITDNDNYTDADIYNDLYAPIASKTGNTNGKSWYYVDIADKSLRVISLNLYQFGGTTRNRTHFTTEQLDWFCSSLASMPSGYGVVVVYHAPQTVPSKTQDYAKFYQGTRKYVNQATYSDVNGDPIADIIDAFISRTSIEKSYTQSGTPSSVAVSADFSAVDASAEFICYLAGHTHQDGIYYVPNVTNKQLMLSITCAIPAFGGTGYPYLADCGDLVRNAYDDSMDAINAYGIDRANGVVKVARIGADTVYDLSNRDWMTIPYK